MLSRRGFLTGIGAALVAPAIIKSGILMPVKQIIQPEMVELEIPGLIVEGSDDGLTWRKIQTIQMISEELMGGTIHFAEPLNERHVRVGYRINAEWDHMHIADLVGSP